MQEDSLEEFWWDEFVALTVGVKRERERLQISPVSCPAGPPGIYLHTYHQKKYFGNSVGLVKVSEACLRSANVTKPENKHFVVLDTR